MKFFKFLKRGIRLGSWPLLQKYIVMPKILSLPPIELSIESIFCVHILLCKQHILMFHWMLRSLYINTNIAFSVVVHDDGSLSEKQIIKLASSFKNIKIIRKSDADIKMAQLLKSHPNLQTYRKNNFWAIKALDVYALAETERIILLDPDLIFLNNCDDLFTNTYNSSESIWMLDNCYALGIDSPTCEKILGVSKLLNVNTGCGNISTSIYNPDLAEKFLKQVQSKPQSDMIFHALFSSYPVGKQPKFLPKTYEVSFDYTKDEIICKHYVNPIRYWFYEQGIPKAASKLNIPLHPWLKERL